MEDITMDKFPLLARLFFLPQVDVRRENFGSASRYRHKAQNILISFHPLSFSIFPTTSKNGDDADEK
jgi:hypothetical protein